MIDVPIDVTFNIVVVRVDGHDIWLRRGRFVGVATMAHVTEAALMLNRGKAKESK